MKLISNNAIGNATILNLDFCLLISSHTALVTLIREHGLHVQNFPLSKYTSASIQILYLAHIRPKELELFNWRHICQQWWMIRGGICIITAHISISQQLFKSWRRPTLYVNKVPRKCIMIFNKNRVIEKSSCQGRRDQKENRTPEPVFMESIQLLAAGFGSDMLSDELRSSINIIFFYAISAKIIL